MWRSTSTLDNVVDYDEMPVRRLRKPPSQRTGSKTSKTQITQDDTPVGSVPTQNLDGFGWAAIWWLAGFLLYSGAYFKLWAVVTVILVMIAPVYLIGSAMIIAALYFTIFS